MAAPTIKCLPSALTLLSNDLFRTYSKNITTMNAVRYACRLQTQGHSLRGVSQRRSRCYDTRNVDISAGKQSFMFDTHALVQKLKMEGFTLQQAEAVMQTLVQIIRADVDYQNRNMVTKAQQEIMMQQVMSHISAVRKDMVILEKSEFSQLKHEYEKQSIDIKQLKQTLNDEVQKLKSNITLDMSLERARVQENHGTNERNLAKLDNKLGIQDTGVHKDISKVDSKIDKEVANLLATFERYKSDSMKYAAGTILTCLTVCLGFFRIWKG